MSLLSERGTLSGLPPSLEGREVLISPTQPEKCLVKGVMFKGRKRFLTEGFDAATFERITSAFTEAMVRRFGEEQRIKAPGLITMPLAGSWCTFASLVEYDRAIHAELSGAHPHILTLLGAASAEYGIGSIYRMLDTKELLQFLEGIARMHDQYQKYGVITFTATPHGAQMRYDKYICYSPYFCASAIGFFLEAILRHGGQSPVVREVQCTCRSASACVYDLVWQ